MISSKRKTSGTYSSPSPKKISAYHESLTTLFEEIQLAIQWGRPSILLAVHRSRIGQGRAQAALETDIGKIAQKIVRIKLKEMQADLIPNFVLRLPARERKVYFFSYLVRQEKYKDGKDIYRALNLCRESFIENRIRAVFWLTLDEASDLPHFAPDFWAFRHRVVDFPSKRLSQSGSIR